MEIEEARSSIQAGRSSVAAPRPLVRATAEPSLNRIHRRVTERPEQLGLALLSHGPKSVLEQVRITLVPAVEPKRISTVERLHCTRKLTIASLQDEVIVVGHEAVRQALKLAVRDYSIEAIEEIDAVGVEGEDHLPVTAPRVHVIDGAGHEVAGRTSHACDGRARRPATARMWMNRQRFGTPNNRCLTPIVKALLEVEKLPVHSERALGDTQDE